MPEKPTPLGARAMIEDMLTNRGVLNIWMFWSRRVSEKGVYDSGEEQTENLFLTEAMAIRYALMWIREESDVEFHIEPTRTAISEWFSHNEYYSGGVIPIVVDLSLV